MRYYALATDFDGTIAHHGIVNERTIQALQDVRKSRRKLILVTGRELDDLMNVFPHLELFDRVVAEDGAVLYRPATREEKVLAEAPPPEFAQELIRRGADRVSVGRAVVATWVPHETTAIETIRDLGLELQVIFNKGAVMILPSGVNKATGMATALHELGLSFHNVAGIGDAENDHAFLSRCECAVAVSNALNTLKHRVDWVTQGDHGDGAIEMMQALLALDLSNVPDRPGHMLRFGHTADGREVAVKPYGTNVLIAGTSGAGKSTFATSFIERLCELMYQFLIVDPEGDYSTFKDAVILGDDQSAPSVNEVMDLISQPEQCAAVNLVGIDLTDRPAFFQSLLPRVQELRARTGRPHWIIVDEAHHVLPSSSDAAGLTIAQNVSGIMLITLEPDRVAPAMLNTIDTVVAIGERPQDTLRIFTEAIGQAPLDVEPVALNPGEALVWFRKTNEPPVWVRSMSPKAKRERHRRKYAEGELSPELCFYFRGAEGKLNLKAQNLSMFLQIGDGVDDETWLHHLQNGDFAEWFRSVIKDPELAEASEHIRNQNLGAQESRELIRTELENRYILAA